MRNYAFQRLVRVAVVLFGLTLLVFLLLSASGDPARILAPQTATAADLAAMRHDFGLDQPIYVQYWRFLQHAVVGDFGRSWTYQQDALGLVLRRLPISLELAVVAMLFAVVLGIALGVASAVNQGLWIDTLSVGIAVMLRAMPGFWLGLMFIVFFSVLLGWLPTSGSGSLKNLIMPATVLGLSLFGDILLLVRSGLLEVLDEDYIRTARAKGLTERAVYFRHALRNSAIPVVSVAGVTFGRLIGGAIIVETIFAWPGVGSLAVGAVSARDFPLVEASVLVLASIISVVNLATDLSYSFVDPRIRHA